MADLIPMDELTELKPASAVAAVSSEAVSILERQSVACAINQAANCGEHQIVWSHDLSDQLMQELKNNGYQLRQRTPVSAADRNPSWIISGF